MILLRLALKSAWNRKLSLSLSVISIALSFFLILGVDMARKSVKENFLNTVSKTDLIVGARTGQVNLLLYTLFHIGSPTNNISWNSFKEISSLPEVSWAVPVSLGDSHHGYRVIGTTPDFFQEYKFSNGKPLKLSTGKIFTGVWDAVIGSEVARKLGYKPGSPVVLSHGLESADFSGHNDKPFYVTGVLEKTSTPVDRSILISLAGMEAIHVDWHSGSPLPIRIPARVAEKMHLEPDHVTGFLIGLKNRTDTFQIQRQINNFKKEPLLAIMPGVTLSELWRTLGGFENMLLVISSMVLLTGLLGLVTAILSSLNERRREMAILRAIGAHPYEVFFLISLEAMGVLAAGLATGMVILYGFLFLSQTWILSNYGISITPGFPDFQQWGYIAVAISAGLIFSLLPGLIAYRKSLQDGLTVRN